MIRISLIDLSIMDGAEGKVRKLFSKSEWNTVIGIVEKCRDELMANYNMMLCGGIPENVYVDFEDKSYMFGSKRFEEVD